MTSVALFTARALVDELLRGGLRRFVVAPGSRSTPLALAVAERHDAESRVLTDERSMGFFALGVARARGEPVALVCTSGTAVSNLSPAVAEAALGGGALVLLTADRPPELRDCAAPQTIDQVGIFGSHARWNVDVPLLDASEGSARVLRSLASRALATATRDRGGPVHLNVPLREPFVDASFPSRDGFPVAARDGVVAFTRSFGRSALDARELDELAERLARARRGVVVCAGPALDPFAITSLAAALGWPVVADPMSGLRFGSPPRGNLVPFAELLLRDESLRREWRPDCILRFGLTPAPRSLQRWLDEAWPAEHYVVAECGWPDPMRGASAMLRSDSASLAQDLVARVSGARTGTGTAAGTRVDHGWLERWLAASAAAGEIVDREIDAGALFDAVLLRHAVAALPDGATLVVGNSMPVRDLDAFAGSSDKRIRVMANRGASGIDGVLSTALGVASTASSPTLLVLGDLSFLHDAMALVAAARERIPLAIAVVHNDGGGIFSYLPLEAELAGSAEGRAIFERSFATPHGSDLARVAALAGGFFARCEDAAALEHALPALLDAARSGPALLEVRTDRAAGKTAQLALVARAQAAAKQALAGLARTAGGESPTRRSA